MRGKKQIRYEETSIHLGTDLSKKTTQARWEGGDVFKVLKEKYCHPRILYLKKLSFKYEGEIKSFPGKQKLREFTTPDPSYEKC